VGFTGGSVHGDGEGSRNLGEGSGGFTQVHTCSHLGEGSGRVRVHPVATSSESPSPC
jgi:hypothetical protein